MLAKISTEVNSSIENIGARRLHTIIEKCLMKSALMLPIEQGKKL